MRVDLAAQVSKIIVMFNTLTFYILNLQLFQGVKSQHGFGSQNDGTIGKNGSQRLDHRFFLRVSEQLV